MSINQSTYNCPAGRRFNLDRHQIGMSDFLRRNPHLDTPAPFRPPNGTLTQTRRTSQRFLKPAWWQKYFGITIEELDRLTEAVTAALDGRVMTRDELVQEVGRSPDRPRSAPR
jgi:hypothetical protein